MKVKKKSKKKATKKVAKDVGRQRYEYEVARRETNLRRINDRVERYNEGQGKRDDLIQRLFNVSVNQRTLVLNLIDRELKRQEEYHEKFPELQKLAIGLKAEKLATPALPEYDEAQLTATSLAPRKAKAKRKAKKKTAAVASAEG